jgi:sulfane dehydrogenase subunit SoxC
MAGDNERIASPRLGSRLSRRVLLVGTVGAAGALAFADRAGTQELQPAVPDDPTKVPGPPPAPVGVRSPFEHPARLTPAPVPAFTPLEQLYGTITPSDLHYVIARGGIPAIDPAQYQLLIHGMVDRPTSFSLEDLKRFPSVTRIMFLECAGNTRAAWKGAKPESTVQELEGWTSTSEWTGVPVASLLNEVGVSSGASWALAEGSDAGALSRSIPIEKLLSDGLIAYGQNGEALRPEQGYPARLLLPGWIGNTNVKWLRRLKLGDQPFMTRYETALYTFPEPDGKAVQFAFVLEAKSTITRPSGGMTIPEPGFWEVSGIAWSGRGRITRVEVSADGGQTWGEAALQEPVLSMTHTRFRFPWVWDGSEAVLQSRATDETGYVQPTRSQLVAARGTDFGEMFNGIIGWHVTMDGKVTYVES